MVNSAVVSGGSNFPGVYHLLYLLRSSHSHSLRFLPHELLTTNSFLTATRILLMQESQRLETLRRRNGEKVNGK